MAEAAPSRLRVAVAVSVFCSVVAALYASAGLSPSSEAGFLLSSIPLLAVGLWLAQDSRRRRVGNVFDFAWLLLIFWPVAVPWYCFRSRGRRGGALFLAMVLLLMFAPTLTWWAIAWLADAARGSL
jgi:hypothetical protein